MAEKKDRVKPTQGKSASVRGKPPAKPGAPTKSGGPESQTTARANGADNQNGKNDVGSTGKQNWTKLMTSREHLIQPGHGEGEAGVGGGVGGLEVPSHGEDRRRSSVASQMSWTSQHRDSTRSGDSRVSQVDLANLQNAAAHDGDDKKDKSQATGSTDSYTRSAIPYMPLSVAVICFLLNMFLPGIGTMVSGLSILCCGKSRLSSKEGTPMTALYVNIMVGVAQLFTVTFMLVGWFWSFTWGIYMVILALEDRKERKARKEKQIQAKALTALSGTVRPWTLKTS
ncbi:hypothetical protein NP493_818g00019 [Ridgeia piscesae]|uniref:Protein SPEC3 n=1 Tax=Ridgeia piscesae TaxID=27915 RepID=A0AAD9KMQ7_RIDPI|nr:hypothetical protein NP493_818g00019 [Ridgeia piscesae]